MKNRYESITFEFRYSESYDVWVLYCQAHGRIYILLEPLITKIDAVPVISQAMSCFCDGTWLTDDWELIWSDSPSFVEGIKALHYKNAMIGYFDEHPIKKTT